MDKTSSEQKATTAGSWGDWWRILARVEVVHGVENEPSKQM
ncbi:MAG: hypothetical protein ACYS1A_01165 [Planctomycetota bacterium]